ncbi:site-specific integrase [Nocardia sp. CA-151230]|uniref:site-specific integrase n=1 Tax=Nocardia sp. CA-151230 TaxID=3239982 RepID=UPI003D9182A0
MRVQRVLMPGAGFESWTVLGDDHMPVPQVERFLSYLASIEKSPNTIKAYAHDLKDWLTYLDRHGIDWREARLEDVAGFVAWLRLPPQARDGLVAVLPSVAPHCSESGPVLHGPLVPARDDAHHRFRGHRRRQTGPHQVLHRG